MDTEALGRIEDELADFVARVARAEKSWSPLPGVLERARADLAAFKALRAENKRLAIQIECARAGWASNLASTLRNAAAWRSYEAASADAERIVAEALRAAIDAEGATR